MSSGKDPSFADLLVPLMFMTTAMLIGLAVGAKTQQSKLRQEAVLKGVAVYVPGENGEPVFTWKEIKSE
jgi:hypothetical protein